MVREIAIAALLVAPVAASNDSEITVLVYDYSDSPYGILEEAKREVSVLYARAGVILVWRNCAGVRDEGEFDPGLCGRKLDPNGSEAALRIVSKLPIDPRNSSWDSANVLGFSTGVYATISTEPLWTVSVRTGETKTRVLACAIAHELGHVFLGSNSHSQRGLMQRDSISMLRAVRQGFCFSNAESARLSRYLAMRRPLEASRLPVQ